jgi:hypothetical protein
MISQVTAVARLRRAGTVFFQISSELLTVAETFVVSQSSMGSQHGALLPSKFRIGAAQRGANRYL